MGHPRCLTNPAVICNDPSLAFSVGAESSPFFLGGPLLHAFWATLLIARHRATDFGLGHVHVPWRFKLHSKRVAHLENFKSHHGIMERSKLCFLLLEDQVSEPTCLCMKAGKELGVGPGAIVTISRP